MTTVPDHLCSCEGNRFVVTITATQGQTTESGPTMICCAAHLAAAQVIADDLRVRAPDLTIRFDVEPVAAA